MFLRQLKLSSSLTPIYRFSTEALKNVKVERVGRNQNVGIVALNKRPFNSLSTDLMADVAQSIRAFEKDNTIGAIILTSTSTKYFTCGADIRQMLLSNDFFEIAGGTFLTNWNCFELCSKPIIAAVNGYVFGGGTEISLACDIIYAADNSLFSQPEINIGTIPGAGGTQRLTRCVGKSLAMEMILTGNRITAEEALRAKLISKIVPVDQLRDEAIKLGEKIADQSILISGMVKEAVNQSFETTLAEGLNYERGLFHKTFATNDRKEGMAAFAEKRKPKWSSS
uniref:Enoyl-CoA hydratase n=1 Tax=Panagrolaimus sp. PS1159 TaxID=55785 RepID=A0AC35GW76_9BILA